MTLLDLLAVICFTSPPVVGIMAGMSAGISGIILGAVIGLILGGLAYKTLCLIQEAEYENSNKYQSLPHVIKWIIDKGTGWWILVVLLGAAGLTHYFTEAIVRRFAV